MGLGCLHPVCSQKTCEFLPLLHHSNTCLPLPPAIQEAWQAISFWECPLWAQAQLDLRLESKIAFKSHRRLIPPPGNKLLLS